MQMEYTAGTKFMGRGKDPLLFEVEDVLKTFNSKGELVKLVYVTFCEILGQRVYNYETPSATIARGLLD